MDAQTLKAVNEHLLSFVTAERQEKMAEVINHRTAHLRVVLEDIFQPHNASAVMRSCECFGVQNMHVIENRYPFKPNNEVSMGSSKWINLHRHREPNTDNTRHCLETLKAQGYRIVATALSDKAIPLSELSVNEPIALCFGTEEDGVSETVLELADECVIIPMFGFTQSFNISVSAALCLYDLCHRIRRDVDHWMLNYDEKELIYYQWLQRSVKNADLIERRFLREQSEQH